LIEFGDENVHDLIRRHPVLGTPSRAMWAVQLLIGHAISLLPRAVRRRYIAR